jgi:hypothetical protein
MGAGGELDGLWTEEVELKGITFVKLTPLNFLMAAFVLFSSPTIAGCVSSFF